MNRRTLLAGGTGVLAAGLAGCLEALGAGGGTDAEPLYPDGRDVPPGAATHDLFVENFDEESYPVRLAVVRAADGALLLRNGYEAPDRRGFYVPDLLVEGRTYELTLHVEGGESATFERPIEDCPHEGGSRNTGLRIRDGTVTVRQDSCDEIVVGTLPSADHGRFVREHE